MFRAESTVLYYETRSRIASKADVVPGTTATHKQRARMDGSASQLYLLSEVTMRIRHSALWRDEFEFESLIALRV